MVELLGCLGHEEWKQNKEENRRKKKKEVTEVEEVGKRRRTKKGGQRREWETGIGGRTEGNGGRIKIE